MDVQKIVDAIRSNDIDTNKAAIESVYAHYGMLTERDVEDLTPSLVYYLWKLPKFTAQKQFVLELLSHTDQRLRHSLLMYLVERWSDIPLVRTDKFYYLVKRILEYYTLDVETVSHLFNIASNTELRAFVVRCVVDRLGEIDEEMEHFLAEFISKCPPPLLLSFGSLRLSKEAVLKYAGSKETGKKNRAVLCSIIK
ncbi:hypothetical protein [Encephalitozoon cuniculi GB-M1]|uniref:Uncharacterized protein n=2 Tax=Encephalitozoon cuniculi TaxID=6035 RepID=Q8SV05_ENCCU|nr:uncharacterized protein ECU07_0870 [Encephalitozoon cuniculi GB-M1]AGE95871.1 hypothetical protein ECU07_0870 [Encephalitozoon cuniculi]KMV65811.1 hypothetical protein M970_070820 [Encephalitozoon cuniculi EcunIII-L]UYI27246.1 hypothetical protein J0A71_05g11040 [Encephalitozoon cuniculi]CAD25619.1 hypothetical protein [Encephalitozoon cuniculi GB-M1]